MALRTADREFTSDQLRERILAELARDLPKEDLGRLRQAVTAELGRFDSVPVRQYLPVLVGRRVRQQFQSGHRAVG